MVLETEEESGSPNLIPLLEVAKEMIGTPDVVFCMDSGAFDYSTLWTTSSLRGGITAILNVEAGKQGYHSGEVGGIIPETFRIVRTLLDRVDNSSTGICSEPFRTEIPDWAREEAKLMAAYSGDTMYKKYRINEGVQCMDQDNLEEMYLNNTWRPNLSITGCDGLPACAKGGNVCRQGTSIKLSMRLPPNADDKTCQAALKKMLTENLPYNAVVTVTGEDGGNGWCQKEMLPWMKEAVQKAGKDFFDGAEGKGYGVGGSIPLLSELEIMYPNSSIIGLGLIGPSANAHAPNECINLTFAKKLTMSLSHLIAAVGLQK